MKRTTRYGAPQDGLADFGLPFVTHQILADHAWLNALHNPQE
jgi:hypothetical protein